jgi:hypothetical protein
MPRDSTATARGPPPRRRARLRSTSARRSRQTIRRRAGRSPARRATRCRAVHSRPTALPSSTSAAGSALIAAGGECDETFAMPTSPEEPYRRGPSRTQARGQRDAVQGVRTRPRPQGEGASEGKWLVVSLSDRPKLGWVRSGIAYDPKTDSYVVVCHDSVGAPQDLPRFGASKQKALRGARSAIHNVCEQPIRDFCHGCGSAQDQVGGAPKERFDVREIRKHLPPLCRLPSVRV